MAYDEIIMSAAKLKLRCGETDPFIRCSLLGIPVCFSPMGRCKDVKKGFNIKKQSYRFK